MTTTPDPQNTSIRTFSELQREIKAPKNQRNNFGEYNYRSCEDILAAFKKIGEGWSLILTDDMVVLSDRFYVKAKATVFREGESYSAIGFAREALEKKKSDASQITGSASSYARKYALNGLFAIDDVKDSDDPSFHPDNPKMKGAKGFSHGVQNPANDNNKDFKLRAGNYVVQSGKFANRKVSSLDKREVLDWVNYVKSQNKNLKKETSAAILAIETFHS